MVLSQMPSVADSKNHVAFCRVSRDISIQSEVLGDTQQSFLC